MIEQIVEWPASRRYRKLSLASSLEPEFSMLGNLSEVREGIGFRRLVQTLHNAFAARNEPELALPELSSLASHAAGGGDDKRDNLLLALACMELIRKEPNLEAWSYIWSLSWHHAFLEYNLSRAAVFIAVHDVIFKERILSIIPKLVDHAVENPGFRSFTRERDHFLNLRIDWQQRPNLTDIWWGMRQGRSIEFRADQGAFAIAAALDPAAFMDLLHRFDNPYPVQSALRDAGAERSFEVWKDLVASAPSAFDEERRWSGSFILPLLLVIARDQILEAQVGVRADTAEEEVRKATAEIDALCRETAKVLASRDDAGPCAERWTTWLMRQCLTRLSNSPLPHPVDARSASYTDAALVDAVGKELAHHTWVPSEAPDAEPWEDWAYRCVLVTLAVSGLTPMPTAESFMEQWMLTPDEWALERGRKLRERASLFETGGNRADAYGARLLSVPLAEAPQPHAVWIQLWVGTGTIREIVEFGDPDSVGNIGESTELAAGRIMRFVFSLGLMMLDCIADPRRKILSDRQSTFEDLFGDLARAVAELDAIDRFDQNYWSDALRHLAIRREIWASHVAPATAVSFQETTRPTLSDFFATLAPDTENLLALIEVALRNKVHPDTLREALIKSNVNIEDHIRFAERLIELSPKRASVSANQIAAARSLLLPTFHAT